MSQDVLAYAYLPESIAAFPEGKEFTDILSKLGYKSINIQLVSGGIATIYSGVK
jgi:demethylmenaquinone methyltransferase/2-methoxy-6-polyprenyl-1,4-benzoquinol methylase